MGVVHVPVSGRSYFGASGLGAFRRDGNAEAVKISTRQPAANPLVVVGSRSHANPDLEDRLGSVGPYELVSMGSSLKFCVVAEGEADIYPRLGPTSEWDTAAAQAVVEQAGGQVLELDGKPLSYNAKPEILNPHFMVIGPVDHDWLALLPDGE